jgi:glycosyltransferase involved in cell wall biosynthesis
MRSDEEKSIGFSLIMPCYNTASTLADAIQSILDQDYETFELILVDDGSSDSTAKIITDFATKYENIRSLYLAKNSGAAAAMNSGVEIARYNWMAIVDSDAVEDKSWLQTARGIIANNSSYQVFGGRYQHTQPKISEPYLKHIYYYAEDTLYPKVDTISNNDNYTEPPIAGGNFFFTRKVYEVANHFDERIRAGYDRLFLLIAIENGFDVFYSKDLYARHPLYDYVSLKSFINRSSKFARWRNEIFSLHSGSSFEMPYATTLNMFNIIVCIGIAVLLLSSNPFLVCMLSLVILCLGFVAYSAIKKLIPWKYRFTYALIDASKKMLTLLIYTFDLRPKGLDWKKR